MARFSSAHDGQGIQGDEFSGRSGFFGGSGFGGRDLGQHRVGPSAVVHNSGHNSGQYLGLDAGQSLGPTSRQNSGQYFGPNVGQSLGPTSGQNSGPNSGQANASKKIWTEFTWG
ncbi:hypothetical protein GOBAR_DD19341 [Gossypium barbadense]|nr:hypothetical protein GOBAR_DD19341 [Gossypium barbadense]